VKLTSQYGGVVVKLQLFLNSTLGESGQLQVPNTLPSQICNETEITRLITTVNTTKFGVYYSDMYRPTWVIIRVNSVK